MCEQLGRELSKLGWQVDILTARVGKGQPSVEHADGFEVHRFATARSSVHDSTFLEHLSYFALGVPQMLAWARSRGYAALFPVFAIPSGLVALTIGKALGVPSVVFVDAADVPGIESAMRSYVPHLARIFRLVTKHSAGVVVLQGLEDLALPQISHNRTVVIPNGTTLPSELARPGQNGAKLQLLSIGRLVFRKGFREIIEALGIVRSQRSDFHLNIVGYGTAEGEIREALERHQVGDAISFVGRVEYAELKRYYLAADAYLFYGEREGSSLAMIEAAAHGLPLLASDHPGNRTYVEHGQSGFLVEHQNTQALAERILYLLEHKADLPQMGRRSREVAERYSWASLARRYDAFIRSSIAGAT